MQSSPHHAARTLSKYSQGTHAAACDATRWGPLRAEVRSLGFSEVVAEEEYATAFATQRALASGLQDPVLFGHNEPALHHYHNTFNRELG